MRAYSSWSCRASACPWGSRLWRRRHWWGWRRRFHRLRDRRRRRNLLLPFAPIPGEVPLTIMHAPVSRFASTSRTHIARRPSACLPRVVLTRQQAQISSRRGRSRGRYRQSAALRGSARGCSWGGYPQSASLRGNRWQLGPQVTLVPWIPLNAQQDSSRMTAKTRACLPKSSASALKCIPKRCRAHLRGVLDLEVVKFNAASLSEKDVTRVHSTLYGRNKILLDMTVPSLIETNRVGRC